MALIKCIPKDSLCYTSECEDNGQSNRKKSHYSHTACFYFIFKKLKTWYDKSLTLGNFHKKKITEK